MLRSSLIQQEYQWRPYIWLIVICSNNPNHKLSTIPTVAKAWAHKYLLKVLLLSPSFSLHHLVSLPDKSIQNWYIKPWYASFATKGHRGFSIPYLLHSALCRVIHMLENVWITSVKAYLQKFFRTKLSWASELAPEEQPLWAAHPSIGIYFLKNPCQSHPGCGASSHLLHMGHIHSWAILFPFIISRAGSITSQCSFCHSSHLLFPVCALQTTLNCLQWSASRNEMLQNSVRYLHRFTGGATSFWRAQIHSELEITVNYLSLRLETVFLEGNPIIITCTQPPVRA